jgi:hypothetical protein
MPLPRHDGHRGKQQDPRVSGEVAEVLDAQVGGPAVQHAWWGPWKVVGIYRTTIESPELPKHDGTAHAELDQGRL